MERNWNLCIVLIIFCFETGLGNYYAFFNFNPVSTLTIICIQIFHNEAKSVPFTSILNRYSSYQGQKQAVENFY